MSSGTKAVLMLIILAVYLFVVPLFKGGDYVQSLGEWGFIALPSILFAAFLWAIIGKIGE